MTLLTNLEFKKKFDSIAQKYDQISNNYTIKRRAESLELDSEKVLLEVGSGTGIVSELIDKSIICSDVSFQMCKQSIKKNRQNVICCDAEKLPIRENVLDGILSTEMIYYLNNTEDFIKNSQRSLRNNTCLTITMFNQSMKIIDQVRGFLRIFDKNQYFDDGQRNFMNIDLLKELLRKNNFDVIKVEKKVVFPFKLFHKLNLILEKTMINHFCYFIIIHAKCNK